MNEAATVEYLLKRYAKRRAENKLEQASELADIISDRYGMSVRETEAEYVAYNSVCEIHVGKPRPTVGGSR